jgi:hypothetical protein
LRIIVGLLDAGPSVARIFTFRDRGFKVSLIGRFRFARAGNSGSMFWFNRVEPARALA